MMAPLFMNAALSAYVACMPVAVANLMAGFVGVVLINNRFHHNRSGSYATGKCQKADGKDTMFHQCLRLILFFGIVFERGGSRIPSLKLEFSYPKNMAHQYG